jgi:NAD(P)-dependent dehydrogenase (short-subunit alcohol dehydrogenase family)
MTKVKTFLITGVSSGLGKAFAEGALEAGHDVIGVRQSRSRTRSRDPA